MCLAIAIAAPTTSAQESSSVIIEPAPIAPGEPDWYGVQWVADSSGNVTPEVQVTSPSKQADQWLVVNAFGRGVERSWTYGPFSAGGSVFTVPVVLDAETHAPGLVRVTARLDLVDPTTGSLMASRRTPAVYVANAGVVGETWYDEQAAEANVIRNIAIEVPADVQIEGLVGFEVSP